MVEKAKSQTELVYDEQYYLKNGCGPIPYSRDEPHWLKFFGMIADQIILSLSPKRVFDAGCAMGFLVESLWDRGVEAWGVDISEYAISRVRKDMAPYCSVGSLTDPCPGKFDLITCIEVLEHIPEVDTRTVVGNLTTATDTILFSSTPKDLTEPTHVNVRPIMSWVRLFGEFGFHPDVLFEAQFVSPQAFLLRRTELPPPEETLVLFARLVQQRIETHERDLHIARLEQEVAASASPQAGLQQERDAFQQEVRMRLEELSARVDEYAAKLEGQAVLLQQQANFQSQVSLAITNLKVDIDRRFLQILNSRIWRTLVAGGAFLERLPGMRGKQRGPHSAVDKNPLSTFNPATARLSSRADESGDAQLKLRYSLDEPVERQECDSGEVVVRGWAIPEEEGLYIEAQLGELPWVAVPYGRTRRDVARAFRDLKQEDQRGFLSRIDTSQLADGDYMLRLRFAIRSGKQLEIGRRIHVGSAARNPRPQEATRYAPPDSMRMKIEDPSPLSPVFSGSALRVQGWAVAQTGIRHVEVWLNERGPNEATYGLMRSDVHEAFEDFSTSEHCGFTWSCSTALLDPGTNQVRIRATSSAGGALEVTSVFLLDSRSAYEVWTDYHTADAKTLARLGEECRQFAYLPKISILTPVYRTPEAFLRKCVESVRGQIYSNWELILVDDASGDQKLADTLKSYAAMDARIRVEGLTKNQGIAGATNVGLAMSNGDYIALLDHDDELSADALYYVAKTLNDDLSLDVFYSDEDKIDSQGKRCDPFFKPDWSPDLLSSMNYVCHFLVSRRSLVEAVGGLRTELDQSQDYDLILRLSERTQKIRRIPKVLYHWRIHPQSTAMQTSQKPLASDAGRRALEDHLQRTGMSASVLEVGSCRYRIRYQIQGAPEVTIIIPTGGSERLKTAIKSILEQTSHRNYRIVVVDNSSGDDVRQWMREFESNSRLVEWLDCRRTPFNFSFLCNRAAAHTDSPYLLFLNDDTSVIVSDWLEAMLEHAQRPMVGAVGAQLLFPDNTLQHAGVVVGIFGVAGHAFRGLDPSAPHYFSLSNFVRNCAAVTGACLLTRRDVFTKIGGFDEKNLPTCFQDVDLCLKMMDAGYRIVYTPYARLYHYESATKRFIASTHEIQYMQERWKPIIDDDPFYNPNLTRISDGYDVDLAGCI